MQPYLPCLDESIAQEDCREGNPLLNFYPLKTTNITYVQRSTNQTNCESFKLCWGPVVVQSNVVGLEDDFKVLPRDQCDSRYKYDSLYKWVPKYNWTGGSVCLLLLQLLTSNISHAKLLGAPENTKRDGLLGASSIIPVLLLLWRVQHKCNISKLFNPSCFANIQEQIKNCVRLFVIATVLNPDSL